MLRVNLQKFLSLQLEDVRDEINQNITPPIEENYFADQFFSIFDWHTTSGG